MQTLQLQHPRFCFWAFCCMAVLQGAEALEIGNNTIQCSIQQAAAIVDSDVFISLVGRVSLWDPGLLEGFALDAQNGCYISQEQLQLSGLTRPDLIEVQEFWTWCQQISRMDFEHTSLEVWTT